jgi:hypothetical protein
VSAGEVEDAIDGLLHGAKVSALPTYLCASVITTMTQMRKEALLAKEDGLAAKMDDILGELKHGPQQYRIDLAAPPEETRARTLSRGLSPEHERIDRHSKDLVRGRVRFESVDIPTRQASEPHLKTRNVREISRARYGKSGEIDRTVDHMVEYEVDSRRLGPRLMKVEEAEKRLAEAKARYERCRAECRTKRTHHDLLRDDAKETLESDLTTQMLDYGSHVPTSLPLEFSKFSGKVLDTREREWKSAKTRKYDDAAALRREAVKREKEELGVLAERFTRSFHLQKRHVLKKQELKREAFDDLWVRKRAKNERVLTKEVLDSRLAVQNLTRKLQEARDAEAAELHRIRENERILSTPVSSKPAAAPRRF